MTDLTVGTRVCCRTGPRREGIIVAIVLYTGRTTDKAWVKVDDDHVYAEDCHRLVRAAQRKETRHA
jgi:hypothetical protein